MDDPATDFQRLLFLIPTTFPPLSALVTADIGAAARRRNGDNPGSDQHLVLKLGRSQETLMTSLPKGAIADRFDEHGYAMVVADGMGSLGDVASGLTIAGLLQLALRFGRWNLRVDDVLAPDIVERITHFFRSIDSALVNVNRQGTVAPMYSTLTAVASGGRDLFFAHVGHSRAYLFRSGALVRLTRDHTRALRRERSRHLVDLSSAASDAHHVLTDALGAGSEDPRIDVERLMLADGDLIMLCTNGLTDALEDQKIAAVLGSNRPVQETCDTLLSRALETGIDDDVTVVLARYHVPE